MFDFLSAYLDAVVTPERRRVILEACNALTNAGIDEHEFAIDQQIESADEVGNDVVLANIETMLTVTLGQVIGGFGVRLEDEVLLVQAVDVLNSLLLIENYEDKASVAGYLETDDGAAAALADVLALMGQYQSAEYITFFRHVSPDLIDRISEQCTKNVDLRPDRLPEHDRATNRLRLFVINTEIVKDASQLFISQALEEGARPGSPLETLIRPYRLLLEQLPVPELAVQLVGFVLASGEDLADIKLVVKQQIDQLHLATHQITNLDVAVDRVLKSHQQFEVAHAQA